MDVKELLKDKKFQIAAAGTALVGAVVLVMKKKSGSGDADAAAATTGARVVPGGYVQGSADTTGTDLAGYLGNAFANQNAALNDTLTQFSGNISDLLKNLPGADDGSGDDNGNTSTGPKYQDVLPGWSVDQWILDLQKGYGSAGGNPNITYDQLVALNPSLNSNINWKGGAGSGNSFKSGASYRIQ